ncbi:MAG TPA: rhomboid family intramembrane serine protease [Sphingobacteriaceae bacterium]
MGPFSNTPVVVKNLLIINIIFFIATAVFESKGVQLTSLLGVYYIDSPNFNVWQLITYMFMHGGFAHILFNMFALFSFGSVLEHLMGPKRFLNFYLITGLGALALQFLVQAIEMYGITGHVYNPGSFTINASSISYNQQLISESQASKILSIYLTPMVGASGAIFGLLIAFGMLFPNAELMILFIPVPVKAKYIIPIYIVLELVLGVAQFAGDSVAHFAHLGGALFGFILIKLWGIRRPGGFI